MSLLRNSVSELKRLKEEAKKIAGQKMISEATQKLEEDAKRILEQILQDKADDEENGEASAEADPVLTTLPAGDDFNIDVTPAAGGENEVTPSVTTSTDDEGNVDIVIDTNPSPEGSPSEAPIDGPVEVSAETSPEGEAGFLPSEIPGDTPEAGAEGLPQDGMEGLPQEDEIEDIDMTNASAEEIMEKFCDTNDQGTLAAIEQVPDMAENLETPAPQAAGNTEEEELASFLDEALELAKAGSTDPEEEGTEEVQALSEEEMAQLEAALNEDMLDDMNGGASAETPADAVPPRGNMGTTNIMGDDEDTMTETIAQNHTNGRHKNLKPDGFPEDRMRPTAVNEAKAQIEKLRKQLAEQITTLANENKALKEQVSSLTSLNEGLEGDMGQYRSKFYEAMLLSYKTGHVNKLLMEQTTTKDEKQQILESFLNAGTREEVTQLYENFEKKLQKGGKSALQESKSVADKLAPVFTNEAGSGSAQVLNEGLRKDPKVQAMMRIINYKCNG